MNKVNIQMTKPRGQHKIEFVADQSDPHFTNVLLRKVKTGQLVTSHYILTSDAPQWQRMYEADGFRVSKQLEKN